MADSEVLGLRRTPLSGTDSDITSDGLSVVEDPWRSLVEVRSAGRPDLGAAGAEHVWQLGPDWWLVDGAAPAAPSLEVPLAAALRSEVARATDTSAHRTTMVLRGPLAARLLAFGCSLDLSVLPVGGAVQGVVAGAPVIIGRCAEQGAAGAPEEELRVYVRAAFARHLARWLQDAAQSA